MGRRSLRLLLRNPRDFHDPEGDQVKILPGMVVCVTGGRDYKGRDFVYRTLDEIRKKDGLSRLVHGDATGADALAKDWAALHGIPTTAWPIPKDEWKRLGFAAGPARNRQMLRGSRPDLVIAFPGGPGTRDCVRQALGLRIPVLDLRNEEDAP
jgi:hypothetical protein